MEVHLHNPWLTYSPGLHRLREAGLAPSIFDDLDERPLTLDEIHQLCTILFIGDDSQAQIPLPPYQPTAVDQLGNKSWRMAWSPFMKSLKKIVEREKLQWNPILKKMMPWINCTMLEMNLMDQLQAKDDAERKKRGFANGKENNTGSREWYAKSNGERRRPSVESNGERRKPRAAHRASFCGASPSPSEKPDPKVWQSTRGIASELPKQMDRTIPSGQSLTKVLEKWSHQPPEYKAMYSLQRLLVTVPKVFPPRNTAVEPHEYFAKWKKLDRDAFEDVDGDAVKELLKRGTLYSYLLNFTHVYCL